MFGTKSPRSRRPAIIQKTVFLLHRVAFLLWEFRVAVTKQSQHNPKKEERSQLRKRKFHRHTLKYCHGGEWARHWGYADKFSRRTGETKLAERIERGDVRINLLDEACRQHDLAYTDSNSDRRQADRVLGQYAFSRMLAEETPSNERTVAMMTACYMVSKITFEKFFLPIKNLMRKRDK